MAVDPAAAGQDETGQPDGETSRIRSLGELHDKIDRLAGKVEEIFTGPGRQGQPRAESRGGPRPATAAETAADRRGEIREELAALRRQEQAENDTADMRKRVGKLERAAQKPPRELRRIEKMMGWSRDD
jgi:hypothetical protein